MLVVEHDGAVRRVACRALRRDGYRVLAACDGAEGLKLLQAHGETIGLVVSDARLPVLSGPQLYRAAAAARPHVRFLLTSGSLPQALPTGLAFLPKPWTIAQLLQRVREVLRSP